MYNLLLAILAGLVAGALVTLFHFSPWAALVPAVLVMMGSYLLLARRVGQRFQLIVAQAQKELAAAPANQRERQQKIERAIKILESGLVYSRWQFLIESQIHSQIGMLRYTLKDMEGAATHLARAGARDYMAHAFQGALLFQKKSYPAMEASFESAVRSGKKEGLIWAAYAWCLVQIKERDKALKVMARAVEENPSDERLKSGLTALQNDKRLKMKPFEPMWWQFGLEQPPMEYQGQRRVQFQRR